MYKLSNIYKLIFLLILVLEVQAKKSVTIKFATLAPKSSVWGNLILQTVRDIYKQSDKTLKFKVFYGGVHGDEKEMEEKIRFKQLDGAFFTGNGLGVAVNEIRILEVPGMVKNYKELDYVYENILDEMNIYFNQQKYQLLGLVDVGYAYFFSKEKIHSINDIRETKMWTWKGDKFSSQFMEAFDIPAVPVAFTEVIPSLQTGFIDGVYASTTSLISLQWHQEIKYMLNLPITLISSGVVLSLDTWKSFSPEQQEIVLATIKKNFEKFKPLIRQSDLDSIKLLKEQGIKINKSSTRRNYLSQKGNTLLKEFPKPLRNKFISLLKEARK